MATVFIFEIRDIGHILQALRNMRKDDPTNAEAVDGIICSLKYQMIGKLKTLEPFMRNPTWIRDEIIHEQNPEATEFHDCSNSDCKKPARGKYCANCWRTILAEIHTTKDHTGCKK